MKINFKRYLNKKTLNNYFSNSNIKIKTVLFKKFEPTNLLYIKTIQIYYPIFWKININFYSTISFNVYQNEFRWINRKFNNIKYHKLIDNLKYKNNKIKTKLPNLFNKFYNNRLNLINSFIFLYNYFFYSIYIDIYYFTKFVKAKKNKLFYFLILSFKKNKLFINITNSLKKNFLSMSTGLFIKFFEKKKSFKKNKTIKLLMAKYIRKIFLISRIKNSILILKKNPIFLIEIINFFNSPIAHKFIDPIENKIIEETNDNFIWIRFLYFIFIENKDFSNNKKPQKGRIKRKILRKVIFGNKIID